MSETSKNTRPENIDKEFMVGRSSKVTVWLNSKSRSISVSPPRYQDQQGSWRDGGFFMNELPMLIYALQQALEHCYGTPMPSMDNDPPPRS